jgi:Zn-dependent protease
MLHIDIVSFLITMAVVLPSLTIHEFAHGWAAYKFGDYTAKSMGRLTLNPIAHIDLFGTILLPFLVGFGYAKPVPVNFSILTRTQILLVAIAGPASNVLLAIILALVFHILPIDNIPVLQQFMLLAVQLNIVFAVFNLIPIPPLDGSKVIYASLKSQQALDIYKTFSQFGMLILVVLLLIGGFSLIIFPFVKVFFKLFNLPLIF